MKSIVVACAVAVIYAAVPGIGHAQTAAARSEVTVDASVFGGAAGYARRLTADLLLGAEFGLALPQLGVTLLPSDSRGRAGFEEYLHLALFARFQPLPRGDLDAGVRGGVADLYECTASDCWPASFVGAYLQPMLGGRRLKVGARVVAGYIGESMEGGPESTSFTFAIVPLLLRVTVPW
jgi:hypothetical protein